MYESAIHLVLLGHDQVVLLGHDQARPLTSAAVLHGRSSMAIKRGEAMAGLSHPSPRTTNRAQTRWLTRSRINCNYSPFVFNRSTLQAPSHPK